MRSTVRALVLVRWNDSESAFEAWKRCSAGRPGDYTGLSCAKLRGPSGVHGDASEYYPYQPG